MVDNLGWIASQMAQHVSHVVGCGIVAGPGKWAVAIIHVESGQCLAWDGWYIDDLPNVLLEPLPIHEFEDSEDTVMQLRLRNEQWLSGPFGKHLWPFYSFARLAAGVIYSHADDETDASLFNGTTVVAYYPVVDASAVLSYMDEWLGMSTITKHFPPETQRAWSAIKDSISSVH